MAHQRGHEILSGKTQGKTVLMGRKTLQSFPGGRPLPEPEQHCASRDKTYLVEGAFVVNSLNKLIEYKNFDDVFSAARLIWYAYVTKIGAAFDCDTHFPDLDAMDTWELIDAGEPLVEKWDSVFVHRLQKPFGRDTDAHKRRSKGETMKDYNEELPPIETVDFNDQVLLEEVRQRL